MSNPWLNKVWRVHVTTTSLESLKKSLPDGFRLVVGHETGDRVDFYKVKPVSGTLPGNAGPVLVPRGRIPVAQLPNLPAALSINPTPAEFDAAANKVLIGASTVGSVAVERLECDIEVADPQGNMLFGELHLYRLEGVMPNNRSLLAVKFIAGGGNPGGFGGGGSD
jgi:hypothetical protein